MFPEMSYRRVHRFMASLWPPPPAPAGVHAEEMCLGGFLGKYTSDKHPTSGSHGKHSTSGSHGKHATSGSHGKQATSGSHGKQALVAL